MRSCRFGERPLLSRYPGRLVPPHQIACRAMLSSILITAAEHAEPSKTPYYVAGAALVIWALAVSAIGIKRDDFAGSKAAGTLVAVISAALVGTTMAMAVITG
jgi:hypothetical protein